MPRVSPAHLDARREQIFAAAAACFAREGFHATTMQQICATAGLSPGAIYRYFRSKEEIIATLCERELERNAALIAEAVQRESFDEAVAALLDVAVAALEAETSATCGGASLDLELWAEASRNALVRALWQRVLGGLRAPLAEAVRRAQARGEVDATLQPEAVAAMGLALFYGLLLQKTMDPTLDMRACLLAFRALLDGSFRGRQDATPSQAACR
jgi:AcrR family transcriptional regulator